MFGPLLCSGAQGAGGGVAAREVVPQERTRRRRRLQQGRQEVRQGGCRRRAVPAEGGPRGLRRLRPAPPRAPGQVLRPLHHPSVHRHLPPSLDVWFPSALPRFIQCSVLMSARREVWGRREEAGGRRQWDGVRADLRGQGRRLDARR
jgi:hypothetical protein